MDRWLSRRCPRARHGHRRLCRRGRGAVHAASPDGVPARPSGLLCQPRRHPIAGRRRGRSTPAATGRARRLDDGRRRRRASRGRAPLPHRPPRGRVRAARRPRRQLRLGRSARGGPRAIPAATSDRAAARHRDRVVPRRSGPRGHRDRVERHNAQDPARELSRQPAQHTRRCPHGRPVGEDRAGRDPGIPRARSGASSR